MTKQPHDIGQEPSLDLGTGAPGTPLPYGGLVLGIAGDRGVAVYPGQSAEEVLKVAAVIQRQLDWHDYEIDSFLARDVAREVLRTLTQAHTAHD